MTKGDWYRPFNRDKWEENAKRLFGDRIIPTWEPEEDADEDVRDVSDVPDDKPDV